MKIIFLKMAALSTCLRTNISIENYEIDIHKNNQPYELSRFLEKRNRGKTQNIYLQDCGRENFKTKKALNNGTMVPTFKKIIIKIGLAVWSGRIAQECIHNMKIIFLKIEALPTCRRTNLSIENYELDIHKNNQPYEFSRFLVKRPREKIQKNIYFQHGGRAN